MVACLWRGKRGTVGGFPAAVGRCGFGLVVILGAATASADTPEFDGPRRNRTRTTRPLNAASLSPPPGRGAASAEALPPPVLSVPPSAPVDPLPAVSGWGLWQTRSPAPHLVLRPHRSPTFPTANPQAAPGSLPHHHRSRQNPPGDAHHRHPEHVTGARPAIREAATRYRKKVPYSYGYFGAQEHRHWSLHHGHQQDRIEWVLR